MTTGSTCHGAVFLLLAAASGVRGAPGSGGLRVLKQGAVVYARSAFSAGKDLVVGMATGTNGQISFSSVHLVPADVPMAAEALHGGTAIHHPGDDCTPWNLNGTYIGANHGCSDARQVTSPKHGLTVADLGSRWTDADGTAFVIIKLVDSDRFWVLSENTGIGAVWRFKRPAKGAALSRVAGEAVLPIAEQKMVQLTPACRIASQQYLVDGSRPAEDGREIRCEFFEILEEYDIVNPGAIVKDIAERPGVERSFVAPHLDAVVRNRISHRFYADGTTVVEHSSTALQAFDLGYMGFVQSAKLYQGTFDTHEYYIPKTLPFELAGGQYDFRGLQDYREKPPEPFRFAPQVGNVADPANLPERFIQLLGTRDGQAIRRQVGYALGYSLTQGLTRPAERARNAAGAAMLYTSSKSYPTAVDSKMGRRIAAGTTFHCVAYRRYFDPARYVAPTCVYWVPDGAGQVVYIDYHRDVDRDMVQLPAQFTGRRLRVVEKTPSLTLHTPGTVPATGLVLSVSGGYGYIVAELKTTDDAP